MNMIQSYVFILLLLQQLKEWQLFIINLAVNGQNKDSVRL